ncbi:phage baseplate plug family protein [Paenibacillus dendritiformis]|uniref:phage baseplate plug family protein n=1 Tax=Paenibacillus dendritiformis TaxID=130049 RepID=UPI00387E0ED3
MAIIRIDKDLIPYSFDMDLGERTYTFEVRYNAAHDYFTVDLSEGDKPLALGVKLVWGMPLFESMETREFPLEVIVPYGDHPGELITWDTLGQSVHLHLGDDDGILI